MDSLSSKINIKKKISPRKSPLSNKYKKYISSGGNSLKNKNNKDKSSKNKRRSEINVIKVKKLDTNPKKVVRKTPEKNKLEKKEVVKKNVVKKQVVKKQVVKEQVVRKTPEKNKLEPKKNVSIHNRKEKDKSKHKYTKGSRNNPSRRKKLHRRHTNSRKVSLKCTPRKKKNIKKVFKTLETMNENDLKKELSKKGIEVKSNKKQLLEDIYVFSSLGGIKVHKE